MRRLERLQLAPSTAALLIACRAPTAGLALGWLGVRWPAGAVAGLAGLLGWALWTTVRGVREGRRTPFTPLSIAAMLVLFVGALFGAVGGIGLGAGGTPWVALLKAYLCAFAAWLIMLPRRRA